MVAEHSSIVILSASCVESKVVLTCQTVTTPIMHYANSQCSSNMLVHRHAHVYSAQCEIWRTLAKIVDMAATLLCITRACSHYGYRHSLLADNGSLRACWAAHGACIGWRSVTTEDCRQPRVC